MKPSSQPFSVPDTWVQTSQNPGHVVTVLGGVHGNEPVGVKVVDYLRNQEKALKSGTLQLAYGNTQAMQANPPVRSIHPKDMNKSFGNPVLDAEGKLTFESLRANLLKGMLASSDVLFDVHSTIKPSHPHIVVPNLNHPLAQQVLPYLGIPTVITGQGLFPPTGEPIYADTFVSACGGLGMTVEAGWSQNPEIGKIIKNVENALIFLDIHHGNVQIPELQIQYWNAYWNVLADAEFHFTKEWGNFDELAAGTVFAETEKGPISVEKDSIILYPKPEDKIVPGQEACIIAHKIS